MKTSPALLVALLFLSANALQAQAPQQVVVAGVPYPRPWVPPVSLPNGAYYSVDLNKVCSISLQKYVSRTLAMQNADGYIPFLNSNAGGGKDQKPVFLYADVTETTIETMGGVPARFYSVSPHKGEGELKVTVGGSDVTEEVNAKKEELQKLQDSIASIGTSGQESKEDKKANQKLMVTKDYPLTTHARNIEFRLASPADVTSIYQNAIKAWTGGAPAPTPTPAPSASPSN